MTPTQQEAQRKHRDAVAAWQEALIHRANLARQMIEADGRLSLRKNQLNKAEADVMRALSAGSMIPTEQP